MPSIETLLAFTAATFVMLIVPGPVVLYVSTRSATQGFRAGLVSVCGVHTATLVQVAAAAFGVSAILAASAVAFSVVKLAGAAYLVFLGVQALRGARRGAGEAVAVPPRPGHQLYLDGFLVNLLNPKSTVFFLAYFPQFVTPGSHALGQTLFLGALVVLYFAYKIVRRARYGPAQVAEVCGADPTTAGALDADAPGEAEVSREAVE